MPLSEKVRIEIFIPDLPDAIYARLLDELGNELSYAFGGCTIIPDLGKYRSTAGEILLDKVNVLFTDTPLRWGIDRKLITRYAEELQDVVRRAFEKEEAVLIVAHVTSSSSTPLAEARRLRIANSIDVRAGRR